MTEKILTATILDNQTVGMGKSLQQDCFISDFGVANLILRMGVTFSLGAGTANLKAYAPAQLAENLLLIGSRSGGGSDVFVNTNAKSILYDNTVDYGLSLPEVVGPYGAVTSYVGPGTFRVGCVVRIDMAPPRMSTNFWRSMIFPGNGYKTLTLKTTIPQLADLFFGVIPPTLALVSNSLEIIQTQQPTAWSLDTKKVDLFYYQRVLQDQLTFTTKGVYGSYAPVGSLLERIHVCASDLGTGAPEDFLVNNVTVREQTTDQINQSWQSLRSDNFVDMQIGNPQANWGHVMIPWAQRGLAENLLDTRLWQPGKTLRTLCDVPALVPSAKSLNFAYNHLIGPFGIPGR